MLLLTAMSNTYLNDLLEQPSALQATLDSLGKAAPLTTLHHHMQHGKYQRVILTGMGSSYHGLYPLQLRLFASTINVIRLETSELIHHAYKLIDHQSLVVAVSQSGESAEVVRLLDLTHGCATLVGVTNTAGSTLAHNASHVIITSAGEEASVSCKTYITGLAALDWLGDQLLGGRKHFPALGSLPDKMANYWFGWHAAVELLVEKLAGMRQFFLLGRGESLAAACTGALIIKEAARVAAEGMNSAAFRHGPLELVSPQTFAMLYLGSDHTSVLNARLAEDIRSAGGVAETVSIGKAVSPFCLPRCAAVALPILEIMPAQLLSLALAEMQSIEPGKFVNTAKVTTIE